MKKFINYSYENLKKFAEDVFLNLDSAQFVRKTLQNIRECFKNCTEIAPSPNCAL